MKMMRKLTLIKLLHTFIWLVMAFMVVYFAASAILGQVNFFTWLALSLILLEGITLLCFRGNCPLRLLAGKETDSREDGFDIYLPPWLARHTVTIFSTLFIIALLTMIIRLFL